MKSENKYFIFDFPRERNLKELFKYIVIKLLNLAYHFILGINKPNESKKKYRIAICCIFKNEAPYLREWLTYHKVVGVEHVYLYNNNSTDDYLEVLKPFIEEKFVTLISWPYDQAQIAAYKDCITKHKTDANWLGFIDVDEFVTPNEDDNLFDFLNNYKNYPSVKIYWKVFGTSGFIHRDITSLVTEDFTVCWSKYDEVGKCFYNTSFDFDPQNKHSNGLHHSFWGKHLGISIPPVNCFHKFSNHQIETANNTTFPIQINHYFTKSFNEYLLKSSKGDAFYKNNPHNLEYFYKHEMLCVKTDYHAYKYLLKLKTSLLEIY